MAKKLSKAQLEEKVESFFKTYPDAEKAFVTNDGNVFAQKNRADLHAKSDKDLKVTEYDNEAAGAKDADDDQDDKPSTAAEIIEFAKTAELEDAESYLDAENKSDKPRSTVIKALESRIEQLKADA